MTHSNKTRTSDQTSSGTSTLPPTRLIREHRARYWRTFRRKLGEGFDLARKALMAAAMAATFTPLATKGELRFPTITVGAILAVGLVSFLFGVHLQAEAKPDE